MENRVKTVASTATIGLQGDDWKDFVVDIELIDEAVETLGQVDLDDVEPTVYMTDLINVTRDDIVRPSLSLEDALANAPKTEDNCFWVPRILED